MKFSWSVLLCLATVSIYSGLQAQQAATTPSATIVPQLVNFSGVTLDAQGKPIARIAGVTFSIYKDQYNGAPLWMEVQNVHPDASGNYTAQLGSTRPQGLPLELFASGEARWLGVRVEGAEEQPRILLLSVPYALKAADAQTLGGLPPSAFVLAGSAGSNSISTSESSPSPANSTTPGATPAIGGSGTANYLPIWTDSADLGTSIVSQAGTGSTGKIGINQKNPIFTLDVGGQELVRGLFELSTTAFATATTGYNSNPLNIESSSFNSSTGKAAVNHFQWQAEATGNNTATPGATLNLLYGTDPNPPAETGLKLSNKGVFTFATGQTFPGAGSVTSVGLSAPSSDFTVTGSPVTTSGTLALAWKVAPTNNNTLNAIVKRDANGAFSAGQISAFTTQNTGAVTGTNAGGSALGPGVAGISNEGFGVSGVSQYGYGVYGNGYYGVGVYGATYSGQAVYGTSVTNDSVAVYGNGPVAGQFVGQILAGTATAGGYLGQIVTQGQTNNAIGYYLHGAILQGAPGYSGVFGFGGDTTDGSEGGVGGVFQGGVNEVSLDLSDGIDSYSGYYGDNGPGGYAGFFSGDVDVEGTLYKNGGAFKIDHPLDPANKYLQHSFVESPDMMNVYNGNVVLDGNGEATVQLPEWFETLNRDFRYQLTSIGGFAPIYIAEKVQNNTFKIGGGKVGMEVSWQVTGIRQDPWANAHRIPTEQVKDARERGFYLNPELYGAPREKGIDWARHPTTMKELSKHTAKALAKTTSLKP